MNHQSQNGQDNRFDMVVLSGMGDDGAAGAAQLHLAGGYVLVEDTENSADMADTQDLDEYRRCGLRAVQSTPLILTLLGKLRLRSNLARRQRRTQDCFHPQEQDS